MPDREFDIIPDPETTNIRQKATRYERACRLWGVNEFVKPIRDHPSLMGSEIQTAANNLHSLLRFHVTILHNLDQCLYDIDFAKKFFCVSDYSRAKDKIEGTTKINKLSFTAMANFFIEVILRRLISKFGDTSPGGFYNVAQETIKLAILSDPQQEHLNGLTVLSKIRNTLHNNGIYLGYKDTNACFDLAGVQYSFTHGKVIEGCVTWDHLAHGLACALKTIKELLINCLNSYSGKRNGLLRCWDERGIRLGKILRLLGKPYSYPNGTLSWRDRFRGRLHAF